MKCYDCQSPLQHGDKFCGNCGRKITGRTERQNVRRYPAPESLQAYEQLTAGKRQNQKTIDRVLLGILGVIALLGFIVSISTASPVGWVGSIGVVVIAVCYHLLPNRDPYLSSREYFSIPHARTDNNKTRCVMCGHVGLYTHGQYKSQLTFHDCSNCGITLYVS